jgi:predicted chitinase
MLAFIKRYFAARDEVFLLLREAKWTIALALLLSVVLLVPEQTRELYRMLVADITFISPTLHDATFVAIAVLRFAVPLILIGTLLWFGVYQIVTDSIARVDPNSAEGRRFAEVLPIICGALPLLACALGQFLAMPHFSSAEAASELPAGPWDDFGQTQAIPVGRGLLVASLVTVAVAAVLCIVWWKTRESLRSWSGRLNERYFLSNWFLALTILVLLGVALAFYQFPVALPQALGVFGIVALFALCTVAFCVHFALLTIKYRFPFIPVILGCALVFALLDLNDNHTVRGLTDQQASAGSSGAVAVAAEQFETWYESRLPALATYDEYPVYIVAAQGGGIYAAYQTAMFLGRLYDYCPAFNEHLFAISSVSGGSLGAAAYAAAVKSINDKPAVTAAATSDPCPAITAYLGGEKPVLPHNLLEPKDLEIHLRKVFAADLLSPVVGRALFTDFSQSFLPVPIGGFDRARALEFAFENAEAALHDDRASYLTKDYAILWTPQGKTPALLINTTDAGSGRRVLISPFALTGTDQAGVDSVIRYQDLGQSADPKDRRYPPALRLSTAAGISARFSWVTPAATIPVGDRRLGSLNKIRLVDGGYVENSGVETALDLVDAIQETVKSINKKAENPALTIGSTGQPYRKVRLRLIVLSGGDYPVRTSFAFGDEIEPIRALLNTRSSRAYVAIGGAERRYPPHPVLGAGGAPVKGVELSDFSRTSLESRFYPLPLGWVMSNRTRQIIEKQSGYYWDCDPGRTFKQSLATLSEADCIQRVVYNELNKSLPVAASEIATVLSLPPLARDGQIDPRLPHKELINCYRDAGGEVMVLPQSTALDALLQIWDAHREWADEHLLAVIVATIANETEDFKVRSENLSFPAAERIKSLWPTRFPTVADAEPYVGKPEALAEKVYGDRFENRPGDAYRYRGRGMAMLLGREDYERYGRIIGVDLVSNPDFALNPVIGARAAFAAYFDRDTIDQLNARFSQNPTDWDGAVATVHKIGDKNGIVARSKTLYQCIGEVKPK